MALKSRTNLMSELIHHSDRGIQYCSKDYVDVLIRANILISMTENGDPYENALAERINGILKSEFGLSKVFNTHLSAKKTIKESIQIYNQDRPHSSCNFFTPEEAHLMEGTPPKKWKSYSP